jgi:hypothetical protein
MMHNWIVDINSHCQHLILSRHVWLVYKAPAAIIVSNTPDT